MPYIFFKTLTPPRLFVACRSSSSVECRPAGRAVFVVGTNKGAGGVCLRMMEGWCVMSVPAVDGSR